MNTFDIHVLDKLDKADQEKITYFSRLLLDQAKYKKLKEEIYGRRDEIKKEDTLNHDDFWKQLGV